MQNFLKAFVLFFVIGISIYFNCFNNKFMMDDLDFISDPLMSSPKFIFNQWDPFMAQKLGVLDQTRLHSYYRPLAHMLYDVIYSKFKKNFWQYHLLNVFLFAFAITLVFLLIFKISNNYCLAFLTALFYLVHPINGIVINYISAGVFALELIFMLATILLLWESLANNRNRILYALSLCSCFLSLFWHESGMMIVFYLATTVMIFRKESLREKILYLMPYFIIIAAFVIFRFFILDLENHSLLKLLHYHLKFWEYPANLFRIFTWYFSQIFYPNGIVLEWAGPFLHQGIFWHNLGLFLVFSFMLFLLFYIRKEKICQLAVFWCLIGFFPVCFAAYRLPDDGVVFEPHWLIFSSIGIFIFGAYYSSKIISKIKIFGFVFILLLIFIFSAISFKYNYIWSDQKIYNKFWSEKVPTLDAPYIYLAEAYQKDGKFKKSRLYSKLALDCGSRDHIQIYNNLGIIELKEGNLTAAEADFKKVLHNSPLRSAAFDNNLGKIYWMQGKVNLAEKYFKESIVLDNLLLESKRNLAMIYFNRFEYEKVISLCRRNLEIVDNDPKTIFILINVYVKLKDIKSIKMYAKRLINTSDDVEVLSDLGITMMDLNENLLALESFIRALKVDPSYKSTYLNLASFFQRFGKYDQAIYYLKIGSKIDSSDLEFKKRMSELSQIKDKEKLLK